MRRYFFLILFAFVLITPFVLRAWMGVESHSSRPADMPRVVIITPHLEGIRREFQDGFSNWLKAQGKPDVFLDFRNYGGGSADIVKYFQSSQELYSKTGSYSVDLVWGGGDDLFNRQLKGIGVLDRFELPADVMTGAYPTADIAGVPLYDKDHQWYGTALGSFGIVYNKDVLRYLKVPEPKAWDDLADARYRGWLVLADPTRSASAKTAFMAIIERAMATAAEQGRPLDAGWADGMGLIRLICANNRMFADASASVPAMVGRGDAAAGMAIDFYGRTQVQYVGEKRVGYVEPAGATVVNPDPIALVKGAPNRETAELFVRYVLSEAGQKLWAYKVGAPGGPASTELRRLPIRRSVYEDKTHFADPTNPYTAAGTFNTKKERTDTFSIIGELIQASCVDLLPELIATQDAIRSVSDPAREAALEKRLGTFPFDRAEALRRLKAYQGPKDNPTKPLERLRMIRQWTAEFRSEYEAIRRDAGK